MAASNIMGVNKRTPCTTPQTLTPKTHCQSATEFSQIKPPEPTPALLNTKCGTPKCATTSLAKASICSALETSTRLANTWTPKALISASALSSASCCTSTKTTFILSLAAMRAHSKPKPEPPPVRTAVLFSKLRIMI